MNSTNPASFSSILLVWLCFFFFSFDNFPFSFHWNVEPFNLPNLFIIMTTDRIKKEDSVRNENWYIGNSRLTQKTTLTTTAYSVCTQTPTHFHSLTWNEWVRIAWKPRYAWKNQWKSITLFALPISFVRTDLVIRDGRHCVCSWNNTITYFVGACFFFLSLPLSLLGFCYSILAKFIIIIISFLSGF